jgi:hypothetical protein
MSRENQREWYPAKNEPTGCFIRPEGKLRSDRPLAGTLRFGTAPGVGPNGPLTPSRSDFGMDRISPRRFDPMGTAKDRYTGTPPEPAAKLISQEARGKRYGNKS